MKVSITDKSGRVRHTAVDQLGAFLGHVAKDRAMIGSTIRIYDGKKCIQTVHIGGKKAFEKLPTAKIGSSNWGMVSEKAAVFGGHYRPRRDF